MKRGLVLVSLLAVGGLMPFGATGHAAPTTVSETQYCPFPVVGGDPDRVMLAGPTTPPATSTDPVTYTVTADESVGEGSHVVTLQVSVSSSDYGSSSTSPANGIATSATSPAIVGPATVTLTLEQGHNYTIDWNADFDFGIHPCSSSEPGEMPFSLAT